MSLTEQIDHFATFARRMASERGDQLSLAAIMAEWQTLNADDMNAVSAALVSYDEGERGVPVDEFLAERKKSRGQRSL